MATWNALRWVRRLIGGPPPSGRPIPMRVEPRVTYAAPPHTAVGESAARGSASNGAAAKLLTPNEQAPAPAGIPALAEVPLATTSAVGQGPLPVPKLPVCHIVAGSEHQPGQSAHPRSQLRGRPKHEFRWIAPGRLATIHGFDLPGGMIYVGSSMPADPSGGWAAATPAPCLINPGLQVAPRAPTSAADLGYWPSYSDISAECRFTYLHWLSGGKRDPAVPIGYVFLYFYGLERRLMVDDVGTEEAAPLIAEVARLREIYGANASFSSYVEALIRVVDARRLLDNPDGLVAWKPDLSASTPENLLLLRLKIAQTVVTGEPLDFGLALAGTLALSSHKGGIRQGIGITRAWPEFVELTRRRFAQRFPGGFKLCDRKDTCLSVDYRPASQHLSFRLVAEGGAGHLPDPDALAWTEMAELCATAAEDLVPYSKLVGKTRAKAGSVEAALLLPPELASEQSTMATFVSWLAALPLPVAQVPLAQLAGWCFGDAAASLGAKHLAEISAMLDRLGYGMEPDAAHGLIDLRPGRDVFVFRTAAPSGATAPLSATFQQAALVAAVVASTAGAPEMPQDDGAHTIAVLVEQLRLGTAEAARLTARFKLMQGQPLPVSRLLKLAAMIAPSEREAVARLAAAAVGRTGNPAAVDAMVGLYDALGINRRVLYGILHRGAAASAPQAAQPVIVEQRDARGGTHRIPPPPAKTPTHVTGETRIDMARVSNILRETREVAQVLAPIYEDEEPLTAEVAQPPRSTVDEGRGAGLDADHGRLLDALRAQPRWSRAAFAAEARGCGLMPDGAAEAINEWAFDAFGDQLIEDGEPMTINVALLPAAPGAAG